MNQINIQIPEGHVIDTEKSNLEEGRIIFKKKEVTPWIKESHTIYGYFVSNGAEIKRWDSGNNQDPSGRNIFAKRKQAQSMLAMAQLSQIIQNDERFGGPITDKEWENEKIRKFAIIRSSGKIIKEWYYTYYTFLTFHTQEQRDLFLAENINLIKQYYMLD